MSRRAARPRLFVELCCGSAAVTLRLLGGPRCKPPIAYMGSKRGYAHTILHALGLRSGMGAEEVLLCDAGPWGRVWQALSDYETGMAVAAQIMAWKDEDPRALWDRLRAEGVPDGSDAAAWLMMGPWSFREGMPQTGFAQSKAYAGEWVGANGEVGIRVPATPMSVGTATATATGTLTLDRRRVTALCADVRTIDPPDDCRGVYVYVDPDYQGTTGYKATLPRADVLALAQRWSDAGAVVCVSEAVPLPLEGWWHVEIGGERVGQKRTFSRQQSEWLTMNRAPAWAPSVQGALFAREATA